MAALTLEFTVTAKAYNQNVYIYPNGARLVQNWGNYSDRSITYHYVVANNQRYVNENGRWVPIVIGPGDSAVDAPPGTMAQAGASKADSQVLSNQETADWQTIGGIAAVGTVFLGFLGGFAYAISARAKKKGWKYRPENDPYLNGNPPS
jgi:hypothetical protein